ncbi:transcriptional regulator, y4mF family [Chitinophaga sp. CF118]|uniref:helix-turn-helix transcriptional regulator n=1 Tax=Chitinophaga sp. CF118 TaxID=1884367 RepID=UPI0008F3FF28|nr:transcriptional regulator, y4mF family [Chitinophaga sp. CF118]
MALLSKTIKAKRKENGLTQEDLSLKSGLGLRLIREIEQGKTSMHMDKVNQLLSLFGMELVPAPIIQKALMVNFFQNNSTS